MNNYSVKIKPIVSWEKTIPVYFSTQKKVMFSCLMYAQMLLAWEYYLPQGY